MRKNILRRFTHWQVAIVAVLVMVIVEVAGLGGVIKTMGSKLVFPAQKLTRQLVQGFLKIETKLVSIPKSTQKIQDLELRLAESSVALGELDHLRKENEELRGLLEDDGGGGEDSKFITAPVMILSRPSLAIGSERGVVAGSLVFSRGVLLGRVNQVFADYSQVELLSEKDARPILVQTESGMQGIIRGDGGRVLLTEVSPDVQLQTGERVVTVGQSDFPPDLFIGRISQIKKDPTAATQTAILEQYTSFYEVPVVEVK